MSKKHDLPSHPFYWGDWFKAMDLQSLPRATRCVWFEMLGRMWESNERGYLTINGKPMSDFAKASALGFGSAVEEYLAHEKVLEDNAIFSRRESDGAIFSRKILNDIDLSEKRAKYGSLGGKKTWLFAKANAKANTEYESEYENKDTTILQIQQVFDFFCFTLRKKILLSSDRKRIIEHRLREGRTVEELKRAIANFSKDEWPDRHKFCDIVYAIGTRNKVDNLDKWLTGKEGSKPTPAAHPKDCPECFGNGLIYPQGGGKAIACWKKYA